MRYGGDNEFDTSDTETVVVDKIDTLLDDVVVSVLQDYGPDPGDTRVERMARWLALNLGGPPYDIEQSGNLERTRLDHGSITVLRVGEKFMIDQGGLTMIVAEAAHEARCLAVALLRAAENSED